MKTIELSKNKVAFVDNQDFEWLNKFEWQFSTKGYAVRGERMKGRYIKKHMHRMILNAPQGLEVDHINRDKLDNRRVNLRLATHSQNRANGIKIRGTSKYKGVRLVRNKWRASITVKLKVLHLGYFEKEEDAARAYDLAAKKYFKEFAVINEQA